MTAAADSHSATARKKLQAAITSVQKQADAAKRASKVAKTGFKAAKQKFKAAKRAAKKLRKEVKALKVQLATLARKRLPARKPTAKSTSAKRVESAEKKPALEPSVIAPPTDITAPTVDAPVQ